MNRLESTTSAFADFMWGPLLLILLLSGSFHWTLQVKFHTFARLIASMA